MITERRFANATASVPEARSFVLDMVNAADGIDRHAVAVMTSELATNVIRHTASAYFVVTVDRDDRNLEVSVTDRSPGNPAARSPEPSETNGRGLQLVQNLADEWGVRHSPDGTSKTVWFRLRPESGTASAES